MFTKILKYKHKPITLVQMPPKKFRFVQFLCPSNLSSPLPLK